MLSELSIKNFAIIEQLEITFEEGLTVLTGETGAGKSIIIDAVQLLAGGRGSQEFIRHGTTKAELQGMFTVDVNRQAVMDRLEEFGIEAEEGVVILRRDLNVNGKSVCRVNGKLVTIAILREIGGMLIDIHGQHENQELMNERRHIHLLDFYIGEPIERALSTYTEIYDKYKKLQQLIAAKTQDEQQIAQKIDLYSFQLEEIDAANLVIGEEEELEAERVKLQHFHRLFDRLNTSYEAIALESHGLDWVGNAMSDLEEAASIDTELVPLSETVNSSFYSLQDVSHDLKRLIDSMEFQPDRLNFVEERLALFLTLKRKYGKSLEEILLYRDKIADALDQLVNRDERLHQNQELLAQYVKDLEIEANELSIIRKKAALRLEKGIEEQLKQLYMEKATFKVQIQQKEPKQFDANGFDEVVFMISTNLGEPLKPLVRVASGGELSRMMLALKTIFSQHQGVTSIIFDEVDTGVSGRVAQSIAEKIAMIASHSQVLCISHLPQVAAMADHHYLIKKDIHDGRTTTAIHDVMKTERTEELSRMLSGAEITPLTLQHADELLTLASQRKQAFRKDI
ncbi:DNA repair protein RecN [Mammaliicoccus sciuri]|uniref:DNA repair protein RecN n=1 Tax=Sporosarcina newyorkensis TaxID=759851 RepID=A0A1T4XGJ4_9BACL|nr:MULTISPECIES: DNA repair protein RecN [Sporosarcina]MBY0220870.1 DNA repair protein RecN [Sporosarcina aquimarina]SKA88650.1 DNA repair protein RecN (Recombination protein N) [Sporosarcina newyorkensis]